MQSSLSRPSFKPVLTVGDNRDDDAESEDSQEAWNYEDEFTYCNEAVEDKRPLTEWPDFKALKKRLLEIEKSIERRYLLHRYYAGWDSLL